MSLIEFNAFHFRYKGIKEYALQDINLNIDNNRFILLAGETGSGKTSLIRCLNGLIPQFYAGFYKGSVEVAGKNTITTSIADLSTEVGIVFQNPENQLVSMNVEHELVFGLENIGMPKKAIMKQIDDVVELTGIEDLLDKAPFEMSGGEQQRVAIASVLALEPKILVLDEPTANLDPFYAKKIVDLLKKIQKEKEITIVISEHRMDLIISVVDEIILMKNGKVIMHDKKKEVINSIQFQALNINKPVIYSIFKQLQNQTLISNRIPVSTKEAIELLKDIDQIEGDNVI